MDQQALPPKQPWRVLVLEDDEETRRFFVDSIALHPHLRVIGQWADAAQAGAWLADTHADEPDVLLADLNLPDGSGLEVMRNVLGHFPQCECLVITVFADAFSVLQSIQAGAVGYILKDMAPEGIATAILEMKAGGAPMSPVIARHVLAAHRDSGAAVATASAADQPPASNDAPLALQLSGRERAVLDLLARGFSYREIARILDVSVHTVQSHIKNLYRKLAVTSKTEAVFEASRMGLLSIGPPR